MSASRRHAWVNRGQTVLLVVLLFGLFILVGGLLFGEDGMWVMLGMAGAATLLEPLASGRLTLRIYRARPIDVSAAPELWATLAVIADRAGLPAPPRPYYVPSPQANAFAVGSRSASAIALSDGLLRRLTPRQLAGVLAHEVAHIAHGDLRVMGLADTLSRLTHLASLVGQVMLLVSVPLLLLGEVSINLPALALLAFAPHLALLAQLGLSRVREFDADRRAAELTGDAFGLASALERIDTASRNWRSLMLPGFGNPEPSWLRTHPETQERIRRLLELGADGEGLVAGGVHFDRLPHVQPRSRWRIGGVWY